MTTPIPPPTSVTAHAHPSSEPPPPPSSRVAYGVKWTHEWQDEDIEKFLKGLAYFLTQRVARQLRESRKKRKELYRHYRS